MLRAAALRRSAPLAVRAARGKSTTGIVGLKVEPNAPAILESLYNKTLAEIEAFPPSAEYADATARSHVPPSPPVPSRPSSLPASVLYPPLS